MQHWHVLRIREHVLQISYETDDIEEDESANSPDRDPVVSDVMSSASGSSPSSTLRWPFGLAPGS